MKVFINIPSLTISGVNSVSIDLANALVGSKWDPHFLVTHCGGPVFGQAIELPPSVPCISLSPQQSPGQAQADILRVLTEAAPCLYLPSYDFLTASVLKRLPTSVGVVGVLHSDGEIYYQHYRDYGHFWNATVSVSKQIAVELQKRFNNANTTVIHSGVPVSELRAGRVKHGPIRITYAGRIAQYQKRVLDIPKIASALIKAGVNARFQICGAGPTEKELREESRSLVARGVVEFMGGMPREELRDVYLDSDVILFTSDCEGLPIALLEGMETGCVPIVSQIQSGFPEIIHDGVNGLTAPIGDIEAFADRVASLANSPELLQKLSLAARQTILEQGFSAPAMADRYGKVFDRVVDAIETGTARRDHRSTLKFAQDKFRAGRTEVKRAFNNLKGKLANASD